MRGRCQRRATANRADSGPGADASTHTVICWPCSCDRPDTPGGIPCVQIHHDLLFRPKSLRSAVLHTSLNYSKFLLSNTTWQHEGHSLLVIGCVHSGRSHSMLVSRATSRGITNKARCFPYPFRVDVVTSRGCLGSRRCRPSRREPHPLPGPSSPLPHSGPPSPSLTLGGFFCPLTLTFPHPSISSVPAAAPPWSQTGAS